MAHQMAIVKNKVTGLSEVVLAKDLTETDRAKPFYCVGCGCRVYLHLSEKKANYFSSDDHSKDCEIASHHKVYVPNGDVIVCIGAMLDHKDLPASEKAPGPGGMSPGNEPPKDNDDDPDISEEARARQIRTVKALYDHLAHERSDYIIDQETKLTKRQISLLDKKSVQEGLREGIKRLKLVRAKRCAPNAYFLEPKIPYERGEIVLRDAYSDWEGAKGRQTIYFLVSGSDEVADQIIKRSIYEDKGSSPGGKKKDILMLANWEKVANEHYQIYRGKLNAWTFCLIDPL